MLTHNDFDFRCLKNKSLNDLTKEEKEYLSKFNSMQIPKQFFQYVVFYSKIGLNKEYKHNQLIDIYPTFGEAFDGMIEFFNEATPSGLHMYTFENEEISSDREFCYDITMFAKKYGMVCNYKATIVRNLVTFWPETQFVTPSILNK